MGLGSKEVERRIYYMSLRTTKDKKVSPHFKTQMKDANGQIATLPDEFKVSGYLIRIGHNEYEWPKDSGVKNKTIILYLVDGDDMFKIESNLDSMMTRSLINTVLGTREFGVMKIGVRAKNEQANIYIMNDDQKTQWAYQWEDVKKLVYQTEDPKTGKMVNVYRKVNEKFWEEWIQLEPVIAAHASKMGYDKYTQPTQDRPREENDALQRELDAMPEPEMQQSSHDDNTPPPINVSDLPF